MRIKDAQELRHATPKLERMPRARAAVKLNKWPGRLPGALAMEKKITAEPDAAG